MRVEDLGEKEIDATGMPGVTYSTIEWGQRVMRPGREVRLVIPVQGDAELLRYGPAVAAVLEATVEAGSIYRRWDWPLARGTKALDEEIRQVVGTIEAGAARVLAEVEQHNAALLAFAAEVINHRRAKLEQLSDFLAAPGGRAEVVRAPARRAPPPEQPAHAEAGAGERSRARQVLTKRFWT